MRAILSILLAFSFTSMPGHSSKLLTDEVIDQGLRSYRGEGSGSEDYLAPYRLFETYGSMKYKRMFTLHKRELRMKDGAIEQFLFMTRMKGWSGRMFLFAADASLTEIENYRRLEDIFRIRDMSVSASKNFRASLNFRFWPSDREKDRGYRKGVGYYQLPRDRVPMMYCSIDYYHTVPGYESRGIGWLMVDEFTKLVFARTSADFIAAVVSDSNVQSLRVLGKHHFSRVMDVPDTSAPGYKKKTCACRSCAFISLDGGKTYVQAGFEMGFWYNLYLPRAQTPSEIRIKSSL